MAALVMILFWIAVGTVIGWNVAQPDWAKQAQAQVMGLIGQLTGQLTDKTSSKDSNNPPDSH
ncbi:hypothetical protein [Thiorhodovibrio frisius]|uniref:Uncharacterized protein n=1 Tax=Thiorhodovibrio frisius TaxID=631362 RepID=H8YXR6_9GAMM|nr:hypothetical protein [Thiorhodovibrio frisius]EIC23242.1 hypothetical protein Thi970DRAFT_00898 [Thiorhodovibrio frisius]WPL23682.1 hypothetical protein Thiofri_03882 [Thiorhodovibrio frisius]